MTFLSENFENAFIGAGSLVAECGFCDRIHFANGEWGDWEEGELESLRGSAKLQPDKFIEHGDSDTISYGWIAGSQFVPGCPCIPEKVQRYQDFIWEHRNQIAEFLKTETKALKAVADFNAVVAESIP